MNALEDAYRMGYAGWLDGHDDAWHAPFAKLQGEADAVFAALRHGQHQAKLDDAAHIKKWKPTP
jgi:hypothetical protein